VFDSEEFRLRSRNLLIVDDEPIQRTIIGRVAERLGWEVQEASSLVEAKARLRSGNIRTIVIDLCLGEEDGLALLHLLREVAPEVVVIFVSGAEKRVLAACSRVAKGMGLLVAGTLRKPIELRNLEMLLEIQPSRLASQKSSARAPTVAQFERALQNGEIYTAFQPTIDLSTGRLSGMEALARWRCPQRGEIPPSLFIPVAEQSGLITPLTRQVLREAIAACEACRYYEPEFSVAVNISPALLSNELFPSTIDRALAASQLPHGALVAEITESTIASDLPLANEVLTRLSIKGVRLSIDDFGTGHSSLLKLLRSPFTELKIDRSFVEVCPTDPEAWKIIHSVLSLAHELGMRVVAEGIEEREIGDQLRDAGCDIGQGWLFGRPVLRDTILRLLQSRAAARAAQSGGSQRPDVRAPVSARHQRLFDRRDVQLVDMNGPVRDQQLIE